MRRKYINYYGFTIKYLRVLLSKLQFRIERTMKVSMWIAGFLIIIFITLFFLYTWQFVPEFKSSKNIHSHRLMATMTWPEIEKAAKAGDIVIIPLGAASKEHGFHLPMNTDQITADYFRDQVLERFEKAIAAPTITYSYYPAFTEYPGSITLDMQTATQMITETCRVLAKQGFKKFYIINIGISTIKPLKIAQQELKREKILMEFSNSTVIDQQPEIVNLIQQKRGTHADEIETSMMLYIAPNVVNMQKAVRDDHPELIPGGLTRNSKNKEGVYSPSGVWGDPTLATKEKGKIITQVTINYLVNQIKQFVLS